MTFPGQDLVDAARIGQDLIAGKRHIFSARTAHCVRCGRTLVRLMTDDEMDKPCEPVCKPLRPLPWGD